MGWLDKLKALLNVEFNSPLISVNIIKNSGNVSKDKEYIYDKEKGEIEIFYDHLNNEKKIKLQPIIKESFIEENKIFENKSLHLLKDLYEYQRSKDSDKVILNFFQSKIPKEDLEALEASLYLRKKFKERKEVRGLKHDIITRFGDRGNNIANLCTAGYFENFFIPLYNSSQEGFKKIYDVVVGRGIMAVFVHSQMTKEEIIKNIKNKIEISKKYGLKFLHIHGIGETNMNTIKKFVEENKNLFFFNKDIFEKDGIIIVELLL